MRLGLNAHHRNLDTLEALRIQTNFQDRTIHEKLSNDVSAKMQIGKVYTHHQVMISKLGT